MGVYLIDSVSKSVLTVQSSGFCYNKLWQLQLYMQMPTYMNMHMHSCANWLKSAPVVSTEMKQCKELPNLPDIQYIQLL